MKQYAPHQTADIRSFLFHLVLLVSVFSLKSTAFAQNQTIDFEDLTAGQVVHHLNADGGFGPIAVHGVNSKDPLVNAAVIFDSSKGDWVS